MGAVRGVEWWEVGFREGKKKKFNVGNLCFYYLLTIRRCLRVLYSVWKLNKTKAKGKRTPPPLLWYVCWGQLVCRLYCEIKVPHAKYVNNFLWI